MKKILVILCLFSVISLTTVANAVPMGHHPSYNMGNQPITRYEHHKPIHKIQPQINYHIHPSHMPCVHGHNSGGIVGGLVIGAVLGGIVGAIVN